MALRHSLAFTISSSVEEGLGSFCRGTRGVHIGQLPRVSCTCPKGRPLAMRDQHPLLELILLCLFSVWVKSIVPSGTWLCCVFLGNSNTKMQWAEVFELLFWWLAPWWSLLSSTYWESSPGTSYWCILCLASQWLSMLVPGGLGPGVTNLSLDFPGHYP